MVATTTAIVAQVQDNDKKRKQTAERAKANHLSRQLQMRLQYARLKVEHGWQKQTLNEVENLYFHHSHQRGPKPFQSSLVITTTQPEMSSFTAQPNNTQSSLSFISRNSISSSDATSHHYVDRTLPVSLSQPSQPTPNHNQTQPTPPLPPSVGTSTTSMNVDIPSQSTTSLSSNPLLTPTSPRRPALPLYPLQSPAEIQSPLSRPEGSFSGFPSPATPKDLRKDAIAPYPALLSPSSPTKANRMKAANKAANSPNPLPSTTYTPKDAFNFASIQSSGMTYDSFWSNHSPSRGSSPRITHIRGMGISQDSPGGHGPSGLGNQL